MFYTSHTILSSHYSLQSLKLDGVHMTPDSARHLSHYISRGTQLKVLELRRVWGSDVWDRDVVRYVHN